MSFQNLCRLGSVITLVAITYLTLTPTPPDALHSIGDKWQHFLAFGGLAGAVRLGFRKLPNWIIVQNVSFFGALIEVFQNIPELHRDCDWKDWVVDSAGAFCALAFIRICGPYLFKYPARK